MNPLQPQLQTQPQPLAQPNVMSVLITLPMVPEAEYKKLFAETQEIRQKFLNAVKANIEHQEQYKLLMQEKETLEAKVKELTPVVQEEVKEVVNTNEPENQ